MIQKKKKVLVIGAGASGMVAAIVAARRGAHVTLLEQKNELGKKILATGNGRCNFTNTHLTKECYYSKNDTFIEQLLANYSTQRIVSFFNEIGILHRERNGYIYPFTDQATAIRQALSNEIKALGIEVHLETTVLSLHLRNPYKVITNNRTFTCDSLIIATGGKSGLTKKDTKDGYALLSNTKHHVTTLSPALVALIGEGTFYKKIAGIRTDVAVTAVLNGKKIRTEEGELQLTDYGVSGIPIFQISRILTQALAENPKQQASVLLDFFPTMSETVLTQFLLERAEKFSQKTMDAFLLGLLKDKLSAFLLSVARIEGNTLVGNVTEKHMKMFVHICKGFEVRIQEAKGFAQSQVTAGGVSLEEISTQMESIFHPNLYFTGEVLDVDGICGGYNLHFAWATGMIAGTASTKNFDK